MSKYSKHVVDSVYEELKDPKAKWVAAELETAMLDSLVPDRSKWPKQWNSAAFSPCHNMFDTFQVLGMTYPFDDWKMECKEKGTIFECYIREETYAVFAHTPERAMMLAIWNLHNFENMEK